VNYLLTVSGEDKKGLVESLATTIEDLGGNWLQSRLCRLGGEFAGIVTVEFSSEPSSLPEEVDTLTCRWKSLKKKSSRVEIYEEASIKILAADRPGIVKQISHVLASRGANVEEVESRVSSAPFSGEQMFEAHYRITLDTDTDRELLQDGLENLAEELMCDLEYRAG
jgi:glycine cleavage system regulatory protein